VLEPQILITFLFQNELYCLYIWNEKPTDVTISILFIYRRISTCFGPYRPILRRIHTAVHTAIGSVAVPFGPRALYVVAGLGDCSLLCREQSPRPATTYRARCPNGTATEPMVV
jgi:hypothetical protein